MLEVIVIGDPRHAEFQAALKCLREDRQVTLTECASCAQAATRVERMPELLVLWQAYPQEFSEREVNTLQQTFPLSRLLVLYGAWSEGETRSGQPIAGALLVHALDWDGFWQSQRQRIERGEQPLWRLPATAVPEEHWLAGSQRRSIVSSPERSSTGIAVITRNRETFEALADVVRGAGHTPLWVRAFNASQGDLSAVLWADVDLRQDLRSQVRRLKEAFSDAPIIAVAHFPRPEDRHALLELGVQAVYRMPLSVEALQESLRQTIPAAQ